MVLCLGTIVAAPLLAGGVHRPIMIGLMCASVLGLAALSAALTLQGRPLRGDLTLLLPVVLLLIPVLQSIPLPYGLRGVLDRGGTDLLLQSQAAPTSSWPLSLDPPATRVAVGRAAAALAAFLFAYHLAAGQKRRHLVLRAIGITGIVAATIGIGHRILGSDKLYGLLNVPPRSLIVGPFVNSNHTAELLELAAFVCLACAFQRATLLNRTLWLLGTALCAGSAAATLSRGAILALLVGVGAFALLQYLGPADKERPRSKRALAWALALGGAMVLAMLALGAGQLIHRFQADGFSTDVRFRVWRDGLRVLAAHPAGIGRGAFDRVFPIYRSVKMPYPLRFAFLENEPFQFLVDCGWVLFATIVVSFAIAAYRAASRSRRDSVENAVCAGLLAVLAHSVVDFGLETMGVLLPFSAVAGTLFGRQRGAEPAPGTPTFRFAWAAAGLAGFGLLFGVAATAHSSYDDFDALLRKAHSRPEQLAVLDRAERTHPLDYFYALDRARIEPLAGSPSPRLHALNRALRLCPSCEAVHVEVARNLWAIGLRRQAVLEWRTAVSLQPELLRSVLGELFSLGARPEELTALAAGDSARMLETVDFIAAKGQVKEAFVALDQADAAGAPHGEALLSRALLNLDAGDLDAATASATAAAAAGVRDPKLSLAQAQIAIKRRGADGADEALALLDAATARYPTNLDLQRQRVAIVTRYKKWNSAARAIEGLKLACYHAFGSAAEAHIAAGDVAFDMGRVAEAMAEYRMALADRPNDVALWMEFGHAAEMAGRHSAARDAYGQAARLSPKDPTIARALQALDDYVARARLPENAPSTQPPPSEPLIHASALVHRSVLINLPGRAGA